MIIVSTVRQTCGACPSQWEGELPDGRMIYARYRWGGLAVSVSRAPTRNVMDAVGGETADRIFEWNKEGDDWDGYMDYDTLRELTKDHVQWPETDS